MALNTRRLVRNLDARNERWLISVFGIGVGEPETEGRLRQIMGQKNIYP